MKYRIIDTRKQIGYYKEKQMYIASLYPLQLTHLESLVPALESSEYDADCIVNSLNSEYPNRFKKEEILIESNHNNCMKAFEITIKRYKNTLKQLEDYEHDI